MTPPHLIPHTPATMNTAITFHTLEDAVSALCRRVFGADVEISPAPEPADPAPPAPICVGQSKVFTGGVR